MTSANPLYDVVPVSALMNRCYVLHGPGTNCRVADPVQESILNNHNLGGTRCITTLVCVHTSDPSDAAGASATMRHDKIGLWECQAVCLSSLVFSRLPLVSLSGREGFDGLVPGLPGFTRDEGRTVAGT